MSTKGIGNYFQKETNMVYSKNLFAEISKQFGILPGSEGLNNISEVVDETTQTPGSSSPLEQVRRDAEIIAHDLLMNFIVDESKKATNRYCKTMRRTVKELSERHDLSFKGMVNKLKVEETSPFQTFVSVADEIFDDGQINWGRIVAVYAFAARLSKYCREKDLNEFPAKVSLFVGKYVGSKLGKWILDNGGWDAFAEYFPDQGEVEEKMWKGLFFTAVGLGALATVVATR
ncbi:bcl-2-like protein 2 [Patella vulgata]|uniref:bcl-2-like protein 2 n=1 Tax=Patella vulgata TaxID=6465 RepID=UPI0021809BCB|nr:bcl-2-like protein 2 [Patella vulgata]